MDKKKDCTTTYPDGFFELFGSSNDSTFSEPEDTALEEKDFNIQDIH